MSCFCIGDIHGASETLDALLARLDAMDSTATFWFVGDLVNRGPDSAGVIRRIRALGDRAVTILGNHDLSVLALAQQPDRLEQANTALSSLFAAPDCGELLDWLRRRPLMHHDPALGWTMVHAGLPAEWDVAEAREHAAELEQALRGPDHRAFLANLMGNTPAYWHPGLAGIERLRYITNALTRQRFVTTDGALELHYKKTLANAPGGLTPWFAAPGRASRDARIVFGHWSALERVAWPEYNAWCIDTGAAWGGELTAMRLDTMQPELVRVAYADACARGRA